MNYNARFRFIPLSTSYEMTEQNDFFIFKVVRVFGLRVAMFQAEKRKES